MADFPDAPDVKQVVESAADDRFSRLTAIAIVLVTLAAAVTAWLQAGADRDDAEAAVRAERLASQTLGTIARSQGLAELRVQRLQLAQERGRRGDSLARRRAFGVGDEAETRALERGWRRAERATRRATERIAAAEGIPPIEGPLTRAEDPAFPNRYLTAAAREGERLSSLRDAANREGDRAEEQVGAYGVALAMFAVSVFLFGYSLTPYGRGNRFLFAGAAILMATVAGAWTLANVLDPPERPPEEAAAAFADAQVAIARGEREEAISALDRTLRLRPGYPAALAARGLVRVEGLGTPGASVSATQEPASEQELRVGREDLRRAVELDPGDVEAILGLAVSELLLGIQDDDEGAIERARIGAAEAIELDPAQPAARYVLAEALLALGEDGEAQRSLDEAIERTAKADDGERARFSFARARLVGSALTVLDQLTGAGRLQEERAAEIKGELVGGSWPDAGPPQGGIAPRDPDPDAEPGRLFGDLELDVGPAGYEVSWPADEPGSSRPTEDGGAGFDARANTLTSVLYVRGQGGGWVVVPELSGPVGRTELFFDPSSELAFVRRERLELTVPPRCLPPGSYRAELYVDGALAGSAEGKQKGEGGGAAAIDGLALLACPPPDWEPIPARRSAPADGYQSPDGRAGLLAIRVPQPAAPGRGRAATRQALDAAAEVLEPLIPGRIERRTRVRGPFLDATVAPTLLIKTSEGGAVIATARLSQDILVAGAMYAPRALFDIDRETGASPALSIFETFADRF